MDPKAVAAGLAMLALAAAGCGSSGSSSTTPLSRADFAQKANAICTKRRHDFAAITIKHHGDVMGAVREALPEMEQSVKQLGELRPPAGMQSAYDEIMVVERGMVRDGRDALAGHPRQGEHEVGPPLHRHEHLREELGIPACNN